MKKTIAIDFFGTIASIPEVKLTISPLFKERLLTQKDPLVPGFLKKIFEQQRKGLEFFEDSFEFLHKASVTHNLICMDNLSAELGEYIRNLNIPINMKYLFSYEFGFKKPQPIFYKEIQRLSQGNTVYTIGDSYQDDYWGPRLAGLKGYWLNRETQVGEVRRRHEVKSLMEFYNTIALNP